MLFYSLFPVLSFRWVKTWWWKLLLSIVPVVFLIHFCNAHGLKAYNDEEIPSVDALVYIYPLARLFEFVLGMCACHFWMLQQKTLEKLSISLVTVIEMCGLGIGLFAMHWGPVLANSLIGSHAISPAAGKWISESGVAPAFALILVIFASSKGFVSRFLSPRVFVFLGENSFSIYLIHQIVIRAFNQYALTFGPALVQYLIYWVIALLTSYFSLKFIETPCRPRLSGLYDRLFMAFGERKKGMLRA